MDYANVMKNAIENGPDFINRYAYGGKQLVNSCMFVAQVIIAFFKNILNL